MNLVWLISGVLLALFLLGLVASPQFALTRYGRIIVTIIHAVLRVATRGPLWLYGTVYFYNLGLFVLIAISAMLPGGALWLAPLVGVNAGLIGQTIRWQEPAKRFRMPLGLYVVLAIATFVLELSLLGWSAIMATRQSLDLAINPYRSVGLVWVIGPAVVTAFAVTGLMETLLVYSEPDGVGDEATIVEQDEYK